jgi:predicted DNA-binding protein with PD1-like motif
MILTHSKQQRFFVGRLDPGDDLVERLESLSETNQLRTGLFNGSGYLRDPELAPYLPEKKGLGQSVRHEGVFFVSSLKGSISLKGKQREISLQAHLVSQDGRSLLGFLTRATVVFLEVQLRALDDLILLRELDPAVGVSQWMGIALPEPGAVAPATEERSAAAPTGRRAPSVPSFLLEDDVPEVYKGDFLDHPSLGRCKVVNIHEDDRVTVILPDQGKLAEINLEFFTYKILRKEGGRQHIKLEVKRR